jgi:hypothetical protein
VASRLVPVAVGLVALLAACGGSSAPQEQAAPVAAATPTTTVPATPPRTLSPEQRSAMLDKLKSETGPTRDVWFATSVSKPEAVAFQKLLQGVFEEAGWTTRGNAPVRFTIKSGIFFLAAEEDPPDYVATAREALADAAGITLTAGRGYREYYAEKKKENPNWNGFELAPDQTYVIVVGPKPES